MFPAIFSSDKESEGYTVTFPDFDGCITEGDDLNEALRMAKDALGGYLYLSEEDGEEIPAPTNPKDIEVEEDEFVLMILVGTDYIRDTNQNKAIKKTLTIPKWLNDLAEEDGINFSQILQFAIKERLGIINRKMD